MKKILILMMVLYCLNGMAQQNYQSPEETKVEMADKLRSNGKIYVVVAVMSTVLIGVISYLVILDRRIDNLEQNSEE